MKTARRRAREFALQALYAWQATGTDADDVVEQLRSFDEFTRSEAEFAEALVRGVIGRSAELQALIAPCLDRSFASVSPVERAIVYIGAFELLAQPETPFKVIINEAIELGKSFGGTDGHKFVNGVLEAMAGRLRAAEVERARQRIPRAAVPLP